MPPFRAVLLSMCVALSSAEFPPGEVMPVTEDTFYSMVHDNKMVDVILVKFYAPWCGHCKKMAADYIQAAKEVADEAHFLEVDGTVETGLAKKHDINAYPTIKAWVGGHERKYESGRTAKDFVEWVGQHTGHPVTHLKTHKELMSFKYDHFVFAVGFFADPETQAAKHFEAIATVYRHQFTFCAVYDPEIAKEEEVTTPGLVLYKHFDDKKEVMTDGFHEEGMMDFIQGHSFPIFDQVTPKNFKNYYMRGLPIAWLFVNADFETDTKNAKAVVREIALQHRGKFSMVWMDGTKQDNLMKQLGLTGTKLPSFTIDAGDKFPMSEANDITTDTITEHMAGYHANTLTAFHRSVAAPETPLVDGLTTLVGSTVKDAMYDEASDVLLLLHHGSDDESKALLPVWTALGHEFLKLDNIVIAQIDIAVNDAPNKVLPGGYPRVYLIKAGTNEVVMYEDEKTHGLLAAWLRRNAATLAK